MVNSYRRDEEQHVNEAPHNIGASDSSAWQECEVVKVLRLFGGPQEGDEVAKPATVCQEEAEQELATVGGLSTASYGTWD